LLTGEQIMLPKHSALKIDIITLIKNTRIELDRLRVFSIQSSKLITQSPTDPNDPMLPSFDNVANERMCKTVYESLVSQFLTLSRRFNDVAVLESTVDRDRMIRQFKILHPSATEDQLREQLDDRAKSANVFAENVVRQDKNNNGPALSLFMEANDRREAQIQQQLTEIRDLFLSLQTMIIAQGEQIDSIEANVEGAKEFIRSGNDELQTAVKLQKKARKNACRSVCVCMVILLIIGVVVGVKF
jgi:syntaxin 1B/2/3